MSRCLAILWVFITAMEHGPFEDAFPIEHGDLPLLCLDYQRVPFLSARPRKYLSQIDDLESSKEKTEDLETWKPPTWLGWWVYPLLYGNNGSWSTRSHIWNVSSPKKECWIPWPIYQYPSYLWCCWWRKSDEPGHPAIPSKPGINWEDPGKFSVLEPQSHGGGWFRWIFSDFNVFFFCEFFSVQFRREFSGCVCV